VVRFNSVALHEEASRVSQAGAHALAAEAAHLESLIEMALARKDAITRAAQALARLDVASALAERAAEGGWARPAFVADQRLDIVGGRHPVVEDALRRDRQPFVANDCALHQTDRLWLVTGPNMGGKSTFLRQNALIVLLAQAGGYVPAQSATLSLVDRLFSRVGASDNLARGRSTFMVEMVETAAILSQATERSFVILDEVGRGTSTYDGLALAWAVVEAVHEVNRCRCLFATHYHELTRLAETLPTRYRCTTSARGNGRAIWCCCTRWRRARRTAAMASRWRVSRACRLRCWRAQRRFWRSWRRAGPKRAASLPGWMTCRCLPRRSRLRKTLTPILYGKP
jgi:DNA mismatch repair protein MutS